jgi:YD repeat-containing protein
MHYVRLALASIAIIGLGVVRPAIAQGVSYVYDALGRLIAVTDPSGDTAIYTYDAVGNVTSIARRSSSLLSIISFTPATGPVGQTISIYGTGFAGTTAQNTVAFNGTTATVLSASSTQLVAVVPSAATSGLISVTTAAGSAQSTASFVVTTPAGGAPAITSFSPSVADFGATVTIAGTNFDAVPANNRTAFNLALVTPSTGSSAIQILAAVPSGATSGRLRVSTVLGEAVSADDFFVPPRPFVAADVATVGRMSPNATPFTVPISVANRVGLVVFDATAGQRLNLKVQGPAGQATVTQPGGSYFANAAIGSIAGYSEPKMAPVTGTYTVLVDPTGTGTGTSTLTLYPVPPDVTGTLSPNGSAASITISAPGQNAHLTFAGLIDQRISLKFSGGPTGP